MLFNQSQYEIRCEWGEHGVAQLAPISDVVIIIDVLSFSTCVEIATNQGALIFPYRWRDQRATTYAAEMQAELAHPDRSGGFSLSPYSLQAIPSGTRLVLPSPNGATLSLGTGLTPTIAGCLRNANTVAAAAQRYGRRIALIPAGERWSDGSLRPSFEDWIAAGAIASELSGSHSPETRAAIAAFRDAKPVLLERLEQVGSGLELLERGFADDIRLAAALNTSSCVPMLREGAYQRLIFDF